jgi:hypothetical protein
MPFLSLLELDGRREAAGVSWPRAELGTIKGGKSAAATVEWFMVQAAANRCGAHDTPWNV